MVDTLMKFQAGDIEQFTLTTSAALDGNPTIFLKDKTGTLVTSLVGATSADGFYYGFVTMPDTVGMYSRHWWYSINAYSFQDIGLIEVVEYLAKETSGLYANAMEVVNLYEPLREANYAYHEIDDIIKDAMNEIDAKLSHVYTTPFETGVNSLPPVINTIAKNMALVNIVEQIGRVPEWLEKRDERYRGMLDAMAAGSMFLVLSGGDVLTPTLPAAIGAVDHSMEDYTPTFTMLGWENQRIDPDRLDDEIDALD